MYASRHTLRVSTHYGSKLLLGQVVQEGVEAGAGEGGARKTERENSKCKATVPLESNSEEATYHFFHILFSRNESSKPEGGFKFHLLREKYLKVLWI